MHIQQEQGDRLRAITLNHMFDRTFDIATVIDWNQDGIICSLLDMDNDQASVDSAGAWREASNLPKPMTINTPRMGSAISR